MKVATNYGASKAVKLNVAGAFHSEFMRPAYNALKEVLDKVEFLPPKIPVMFNVDAEIERLPFSFTRCGFELILFLYSDVVKIKSKLLDQLVKPVLWERSMNNCLRNYDLAQVIEVGPGNVLTGILRRILKSSDAAVKPRPSTLSV
jgi:[acyl-carrier-protein] S-malonyltransferase